MQKNRSPFRQALTPRLVISSVAALFGFAAVCSSPLSALAQNITVASPVSGSQVSSPTWVRAHNVGCDGLAPVAFGYSVDGSPDTTWGVTPYDVDVVTPAMAGGNHTIYFKSWTTNGLCPVTATAFSVGGGVNPSAVPPSGSDAPSNVPSYATASSDLDTAGNWAFEHDAGTPGWSKGSTVFPANTPLYDDAREFYMEYSGHGGERWHLSMGNNAGAKNFALDTYVYFTDPNQVGNLELDFNQVMSNGATVIYGTQCSSYSKTWEITYTNGSSHWRPSNVPCNPKTWSPNTWHHIQIGFHRDDNGYVVHDWVNLDGTHSTFNNAGGPGGDWLGWPKGLLLVNYQVDGALGNGSVTSFVHKMTIYSW